MARNAEASKIYASVHAIRVADSLDDSDVQAQTAVPVAERSQSEPNSASRGSKRGASANTPPQSSRHTKRAAASLADHVLGKQETLSGRLTTAGPVVVLVRTTLLEADFNCQLFLALGCCACFWCANGKCLWFESQNVAV